MMNSQSLPAGLNEQAEMMGSMNPHIHMKHEHEFKPVLPPGWEAQRDDQTGRFFYKDAVTGRTTKKDPTVPVYYAADPSKFSGNDLATNERLERSFNNPNTSLMQFSSAAAMSVVPQPKAKANPSDQKWYNRMTSSLGVPQPPAPMMTGGFGGGSMRLPEPYGAVPAGSSQGSENGEFGAAVVGGEVQATPSPVPAPGAFGHPLPSPAFSSPSSDYSSLAAAGFPGVMPNASQRPTGFAGPAGFGSPLDQSLTRTLDNTPLVDGSSPFPSTLGRSSSMHSHLYRSQLLSKGIHFPMRTPENNVPWAPDSPTRRREVPYEGHKLDARINTWKGKN